VTYTIAALLGMAGALALDLVVLRTGLVLRLVFWVSYPIVLVFQLIFNGILTGRGVVRYDPAAIVGVRVANAPVEDLGFGFALVLMTLSVWVWWEGSVRASGGGQGQSGEHPRGVAGQADGVERGEPRVGQVGDALLGAIESAGRHDDVAEFGHSGLVQALIAETTVEPFGGGRVSGLQGRGDQVGPFALP
jgi:lycopene cyclase domain-containing protein